MEEVQKCGWQCHSEYPLSTAGVHCLYTGASARVARGGQRTHGRQTLIGRKTLLHRTRGTEPRDLRSYPMCEDPLQTLHSESDHQDDQTRPSRTYSPVDGSTRCT